VDHQSALVARGTDSNDYFARARFTQLVIRIGLLLRMSEYRPGLDVTVDNLKQAKLLLEYVYRKQKPATDVMDAPQENRDYMRVRRLLAKRGSIDRRSLLQRCSAKGTLVSQVNSVLSQLRQEGLVTFTLNGRERDSIEPSTSTFEIYKWTGIPYDEE